MWKHLLISLTLVIIVGIVGFGTYNIAYGQAFTVGKSQGYVDGNTAGYSTGKLDGYRDGEKAGYSVGTSDGYSQGYSQGKTEGYDEGKQTGYQLGYTEGRTVGTKEGYAQGLEAGAVNGYNITDPTYAEVLAFLREDKTNQNEYVNPSYVCSHFARDVCNNAESQGIRCAFVDMRFPDSGHALIAFNTTDKGLVYFEPQTDEKVVPSIGKNFYQCVEPRPGYYYEPPPFDDTITDVVVIW